MKQKLVAAYFYHIRYYLFSFAVITAVFFLFAWLGGFDSGTLIYAVLLLAAGFSVAAIIGFVRFSKRHRQLAAIRQSIGTGAVSVDEERELLYEDYGEIISALEAELSRTVSESDQKMSDTKAYFALWAHQIKTPISAMQLLLREEDSDRSRELTAELFRIEQYVDMVLQFIRCDSGSTDYVIRECDLDEIVKTAVRRLAPSFIRKKIALVYSPLQMKVLTDSKWLGFAVEQLLTNALKYTFSGSVSISVSDDRLIISDTGIGIRPEDLPRIFENSFTGYNGRTDRKSTGIGLYLTKKVLTALGHNVGISSRLGKGTTVEIGLSRQTLGVE